MLVVDPKIDKLSFLEGAGAVGSKLSLIHISEPTRQAEISYAVFCLKKKKKTTGSAVSRSAVKADPSGFRPGKN